MRWGRGRVSVSLCSFGARPRLVGGGPVNSTWSGNKRVLKIELIRNHAHLYAGSDRRQVIIDQMFSGIFFGEHFFSPKTIKHRCDIHVEQESAALRRTAIFSSYVDPAILHASTSYFEA